VDVSFINVIRCDGLSGIAHMILAPSVLTPVFTSGLDKDGWRERPEGVK